MIKNNLTKIQRQIGEAVSRRQKSFQTGGNVQLVAVSKTHHAESVKEAIAAGLHVFGENKVQEAAEKIPAVGAGEWHLIGHLQTNKVKKAVELFSVIYSVDSERLLMAIDKEAAKVNKLQEILLQVNIAEEQRKFGFGFDDLPEMLKFVEQAKNIRLRGLMVIAPEVDDAEKVRPVFKQGYEAFVKVKDANIGNSIADMLSMGMSGDFEVAIEEGANNIRLGTMIFGKRSYMI